MGYMASYPEYSGADHLVEMHSSEDGGRRAGMIVAAVGTGIFAVYVHPTAQKMCVRKLRGFEGH